ncbi:MAG: AI-2E family transporter [Candidatus Omnitrophota bacterium]
MIGETNELIEKNKDKADILQIKLFLGFISAVIVFFMLQLLKDIFIPFFMALFLYFFLNGVVNRLVRLKIPKAIVLLFFLVFMFVLFYFLGALLYANVSSFIQKLPEYSAKLAANFKELSDKVKIPGVHLDEYIKKTDWLSKGIDTSSVTSVLSTSFGSFTSFLGELILVLLFVTFMLTGKGDLTGRFSDAFEEERALKLKAVFVSIEGQVRSYLLIKTFVCLLAGVVCGLILFIGGFDFILLSALFIFVLHYIPQLGPFIATIIPGLFGFLKFGFSLRFFLVLAGLMVAQFIIGNIVEPKLTGRGLNISPIMVLISLIFWGYIWGIVGMILAVPLTSALKIFFENIPVLNPLATLISEK